MKEDQAGTKPDDRLGQPAAVGPGEAVANFIEYLEIKAAFWDELARGTSSMIVGSIAETKAAVFREVMQIAERTFSQIATAGQRSDQRERSGRPNDQVELPPNGGSESKKGVVGG